MVKSQYLKSKEKFKVTFKVPNKELPETEVDSLVVLGSFNDWSDGEPLTANKKGEYRATVHVDSPGELEFRYLLNDEIWINDWHAENYVQNEYGTDNCVVTLEEAGK